MCSDPFELGVPIVKLMSEFFFFFFSLCLGSALVGSKIVAADYRYENGKERALHELHHST